MSMPNTCTLAILYFAPPTAIGPLLVDPATPKRRVFVLQRDEHVLVDLERNLRQSGLREGQFTVTRVTAVEKDGWVLFPDPDVANNTLRGIPVDATAKTHHDVARQLLTSRFNQSELDMVMRWTRNLMTLKSAPRERISCAVLGAFDAAALTAFLETMTYDTLINHFEPEALGRIREELKAATLRGIAEDKLF